MQDESSGAACYKSRAKTSVLRRSNGWSAIREKSLVRSEASWFGINGRASRCQTSTEPHQSHADSERRLASEPGAAHASSIHTYNKLVMATSLRCSHSPCVSGMLAASCLLSSRSSASISKGVTKVCLERHMALDYYDLLYALDHTGVRQFKLPSRPPQIASASGRRIAGKQGRSGEVG